MLGRGDLAAARHITAQAGTRGVELSRLGAYLATYDDLYWVLNDAQQRLVLTLPPSAFDGDTATWGLVRAQVYHLRSDPTHARVYADSARRVFATQVRRTPGDAESRCLFGLALAYKGLKTAAIREGERGVALSHNGVGGLAAAPTRANLPLGGRARSGARSTGASAQGSILPVAWLAQDRPPTSPRSGATRASSGW